MNDINDVTYFKVIDNNDVVILYECVECRTHWYLRMISDYKHCPNCGRAIVTPSEYEKCIRLARLNKFDLEAEEIKNDNA